MEHFRQLGVAARKARFLVMSCSSASRCRDRVHARKERRHTMAMTSFIYPLGVVGFWLVGYGCPWGGIDGWRSLRTGDTRTASLAFMSRSTSRPARGIEVRAGERGARPCESRDVLFSAVFMDTAAPFPPGRSRSDGGFASFLVYGVFMSTLLYRSSPTGCGRRLAVVAGGRSSAWSRWKSTLRILRGAHDR